MNASKMMAILVDSYNNQQEVEFESADSTIEAVDYFMPCNDCGKLVLYSTVHSDSGGVCNACLVKLCAPSNFNDCSTCNLLHMCPNNPTPIEDRVRLAVLDAQTEFWGAVMKHFPEARTGDFQISEIDDVMTSWVNHWVDLNVPTVETTYTVKFIHTSVLRGEYEFGTFVSKHETHEQMTKAAQAMMNGFQALYGGGWNYTWSSKPYA